MSYASNGSHTVETILDERVVVSDGLVFVSGLTASDPKGGVPPQAAVSAEFPYYGTDIQKQTTYLLQKLQNILTAHGSALEHVVKTQVFITDCRLFDAFDQIWKKFFEVPPPRTTVGVGPDSMAIPGTLVAVDVIAALPEVLDIRQIDSPRLPKPLANYTPCVGAGDWLFLAGQLPTEFGDTGLAPEASVNPLFPHHSSALLAQAKYTIDVCQTLLEDSGSDWDHVLRVAIFLKDVTQAPLIDALWSDMFTGRTAPPYLVIGVDELLTGGAEIEIDVIAVRTGTASFRRLDANGSAATQVTTTGVDQTTVTLAQVDVPREGYRLFAVEHAVRAAFEEATGQIGPTATPVKVHAFLADVADIYAFGRGLPQEFAGTAAITTSPSVGDNRIGLEIYCRGGASV
jgi:enamine deaminase RidA (YjgF/YER057c/UK114 family)